MKARYVNKRVKRVARSFVNNEYGHLKAKSKKEKINEVYKVYKKHINLVNFSYK